MTTPSPLASVTAYDLTPRRFANVFPRGFAGQARVQSTPTLSTLYSFGEEVAVCRKGDPPTFALHPSVARLETITGSTLFHLREFIHQHGDETLAELPLGSLLAHLRQP